MHRVGLVMPANFQVMSYAALAAFDMANFVSDETFYEIGVLSESGGPVSNNFGVATETAPLDIKSFDTLLLGAAWVPTSPSPKLAELLREAVKDGRRVASICIGAFTLAEAGWTSAGMTAGVDMALGLVERDMGANIARATAKMMVLHHRRAGGQSQHSAMFELDAKTDRIQNALAFARKNLREALTIEQLADAARLSPRHFTRVFRLETGLSPARAIENLRLEAARYLLEQGGLPIEEIARETGFGDRERMRRSFLRSYGQTPQSIRNASHPLATI